MISVNICVALIQKIKNNSSVILAWLCMFCAIVVGSSIGPIFKYMQWHHISPCLAASWRCQCMVIFLIPAAIIERNFSSIRNRIDWLEKKPDLQYPLFVHTFFAGLAWTGNLVCWIIALQYTTTVQASILTSTHPLMLVLYFSVTGVCVVSRLEWIGVIVAFIGIILASLHVYMHRLLSGGVGGMGSDDSTGKTPMEKSISSESWHLEMVGVVLCLLSSANEVVVLLNRSKIKKYVPLMQYTAATTIVVMLGTTLAALILERDTFDTRLFCLQTNCVFGWMSQEWYWKMLLFGFIIGLVCITGFNYAIEHIPALVFSSCTLVDPLVTGLLSWAAGFESVPDLGTWLGGAVVIAGVALISHGERTRSQHERVFEHERLATHDEATDVLEKDTPHILRLESSSRDDCDESSNIEMKPFNPKTGKSDFFVSQQTFSYGRIDSCDAEEYDDMPPMIGASFRTSSACTTNSEVTSSPDVESITLN